MPRWTGPRDTENVSSDQNLKIQIHGETKILRQKHPLMFKLHFFIIGTCWNLWPWPLETRKLTFPIPAWLPLEVPGCIMPIERASVSSANIWHGFFLCLWLSTEGTKNTTCIQVIVLLFSRSWFQVYMTCFVSNFFVAHQIHRHKNPPKIVYFRSDVAPMMPITMQIHLVVFHFGVRWIHDVRQENRVSWCGCPIDLSWAIVGAPKYPQRSPGWLPSLKLT